MKKNLLLLLVCLFGALGGVKAYTVDDLTAAGWTQVSAISNDASNENYVGNFVYVLVDAGSSNFVMSGQTKKHIWCDHYTPTYQILQNPFTNKIEVWTLEVRNDGFAMCNIESKDYYNSTDNDHDKNGCWNYMATNEYSNGSLTFNLSEGKYSISGVQATGGFVGPWNGTVIENEATAANKEGADAPGFFIYRMAKATYLQKYLQQCPNVTSPVDASYLIVNPTIYQAHNKNQMPDGWSEYDVDSEDRTAGTGNTKLKGWDDSLWKTLKLDYYQTIANLPGGLYNITAATRDSENHGKLKVYIYHSASDRRAQSDAATSSESDHTTSDLTLDGGSTVNMGIRTDGNSENSTVTGDNFRMHVDPYLSTMATEFNNGVEMTAGLWYHFVVANTGNHILTATNLNDIIYATGSETALSAAGSDKFTAIQTLSANTDYYIRSSSNNTLTITPCISAVAEELPDNGEMTAGNWYYFDVATAGHYDFVANYLGNIVYTTNGDLAEDASVASKFSVKNNELSATRYYVKSSSAQTLQWFLTDPQNYSSRMSSAVENWTGVGTQTPKQAYPQNTTEGVETYNSNDVGFSAGDILYQTINDLPNGNYEVSFYAWENFCDWNPQASIPFGDNIAQVFANTATKDINVQNSRVSSGWVDANKYTLNCHVTNGTLVYGVKNIATGGNWAVCRAISLTYTGPYNEVIENPETKTQTYEGAFTENTEVAPTAEYPIVDISGAEFTGTLTANFGSDANGFIIATAEQKAALGGVKNVVVGNTCENFVLTDGVKAVIPAALTHATEATYSRTIAAASNYGTICLPYAVESNENIQYYTVTRIIDDVLKLETVDNVDPGTPAIFKKKGASAESIIAAASNVDVVNGADEQSATGVKLVGTFEPITVGGSVGSGDAHGKYYIKNNQFCEGVDYFNVKAFRAYLETVVSGARLALQVEDEATAINELKTLDEKQGLKDGKYLIGGKIVVVKDGRQFYVNGVLK